MIGEEIICYEKSTPSSLRWRRGDFCRMDPARCRAVVVDAALTPAAVVCSMLIPPIGLLVRGRAGMNVVCQVAAFVDWCSFSVVVAEGFRSVQKSFLEHPLGGRLSGRRCAAHWRVATAVAVMPALTLDGDQRRCHITHPLVRASPPPGPRAKGHLGNPAPNVLKTHGCYYLLHVFTEVVLPQGENLIFCTCGRDIEPVVLCG